MTDQASDIEIDEPLQPSPEIDPAAIRMIGLSLLVLVLIGVAAAVLFRPQFAPAPADIANDPQLVEGRLLYLGRCASCHGQIGKGDGPVARTLKSGRAGDFTDSEWKYGDKPEQVLGIVANGTPDGQMPGWKRVFSVEEQRAAAAYVYHLAGRAVPEALRPAKAPAAE